MIIKFNRGKGLVEIFNLLQGLFFYMKTKGMIFYMYYQNQGLYDIICLCYTVFI